MLSVSGCRGITGASLTADVAARFVRAFVARLRAGRARADALTVVFGRDGRAGADTLRDAVVGALAFTGCRVVDLDVATTPTIGVMADHLRADGGLVLTASHNPAEWNGLKCLVVRPGPRGGAHAPGAAEASEIIRLFHEGGGASAGRSAASAGPGAVERRSDAAQIHVDRVLRAVERVAPLSAIRSKRFRVAVDSVNCSGAEGARLLLDALGCDVTRLHADGTGVFPHPAEPTRDNLVGLCDAVKGLGADVGFAQDPDADRLAILDERGSYIGEEYTLVFAAMALAQAGGNSGGSVAANLSTSRMLDDVAKESGSRVIRSAVGEANVAEAMAREGCEIGGEGNGGVIWPEVVWIRDSLGAMALTLALMTREAKRISGLVASTPSYVIDKRKAPVRSGLASAAADALAARFASEPSARIDRQDGVRIDLGVGEAARWLHVRASNTEPIMRLIAEARDASLAAALLDEAAGVIARLA